MKTVSALAGEWIRPLVKKTLPYETQQWIRDQQRRVLSLYKSLNPKKQDFKNREGFLNFNFSLFESHERDGVSALLRVKNEESKIYYCLNSIFWLFDEIVFVDNGSTDRTMEIVRSFKCEKDREDKIKIYSYPFKIGRCGSEHFNTPEDSVHSLSYYYNWALSRCSFRYVWKWDGDMVLRKEAEQTVRKFLVEIQQNEPKCFVTFGQTVYQDLKANFYLSDEINHEVHIFPYGINPRFYKVDLYESLIFDPPLPSEDLPGVSFYELKFVSEDEFSHLSNRDFPTERKQKEMKNFEVIKRGDVARLGFQELPASFLEDEIRRGIVEKAKSPVQHR